MQQLSMLSESIVKRAKVLFAEVETLDIGEKIDTINAIRKELHEVSPFRHEPIDYVKWIPCNNVQANDYNPNTVAPPEMELLKLSIESDGYTQPIVSMATKSGVEVIDGFHRNRVGREYKSINERILGYLPVVMINKEREGRTDRIASTIRHNRARGKHQVQGMSDIVVELKARNWSNQRIAKNLGMDEDEVLRLCQITGLADLFKDEGFSLAWDVEGDISEMDFEELSEDLPGYEEGFEFCKVANTNDKDRVFHQYAKWECYQAGFYNRTKEGMNRAECEEEYRVFLADHDGFEKALHGVITEWTNSCEHYLTNRAMNRIAWLGQAAACYARGIPSVFRNGFNLLTSDEQDSANALALEYLNKWLNNNNRESVSMDEALSHGRQSDIY